MCKPVVYRCMFHTTCDTVLVQVLMDMFQQDEYGESSGQPEDPNVDISITFDELVKDLIQEKKTYIRELNMIIKVVTAVPSHSLHSLVYGKPVYNLAVLLM